jgi:hypothetical protein
MEGVEPRADDPSFLSFSSSVQTLPTSINDSLKRIRMEVENGTDVSKIIPSFELPAGYSLYIGGTKQISGVSVVDFTNPVQYSAKDGAGHNTAWEASVVPVGCRILIDASHDGGVWWHPQSKATGFDPDKPHQGMVIANLLRSKGFEVTELGRDKELTEELFFGYYIVMRANGFESYSAKEIEVYNNLIERGMNLVFLTDHKTNDPKDEIGELLGLDFKGSVNGSVTSFGNHTITANMNSLDYIAGSVLTNPVQQNLTVLGRLEDGSPVMGLLTKGKSRVFFIGDMNGVQVQAQPFIDNLISWMGDCF